MSDILEKFSVFSEISEQFKQNIKSFHVFNDYNIFGKYKGKNVLFVTNGDKVFAFGSNSYGQCGFGHNKRVEKPQEIPELNGKQIKQFFIGYDFVLALNENNHVFGSGENYFGQLGRGYMSRYKKLIVLPWNEFGKYLKPAVILDLESIIEISCGSWNSLALDEQGNVFSWGLNRYGQVGCGKYSGKYITRPVQLKELPKIKSIHCYNYRSFAVTFDGLVYSWGYNWNYCLGHKSREEKIFKPELISDLNNVISVGSSNNNTYFLTNEGNIHFCGEIDSRGDEYQFIPKILETDLKFQSIKTIYYCNSILLALSEETVYCLERNSIQKTKYNTYFDYCLNERQITSETVNILEKVVISERFQELSELGSGEFGQVLKVKDKICDTIYALKRIKLTQNNEIPENRRESSIKDFLKEVNIMSKCKSEYVVKYFGSKVENNCLYILMELFDNNLDEIIKEKNNCFERTESMTTTEYFVSSHLMKELLESVQYLHQLYPPIIHRDLKPQNILVNYQSKNSRFLKICDFGISTYGSDITKSHTSWMGSLNYMAPEVIAGTNMRPKYSTKADVYSLGKIIYKLFDFQFFSSKQINSNNRVLKQKWIYLEKLIDDDQMLAPDYKRRPTCAQILENTEMWLIRKTELQFVDKDLIEKCENQFTKTYLEFKINETNNSNETNWINKLNRLNPFS